MSGSVVVQSLKVGMSLHIHQQLSFGPSMNGYRISCTVNRFSVGSITNDRYEQLWNACMPTVSKIVYFLFHLFIRDLQLAPITITCHRSALSNPMTFRRLNISRIPDIRLDLLMWNVLARPGRLHDGIFHETSFPTQEHLFTT